MKNDFATKADLKETAEGLHQEISAVRTDLSKTESALRQEITAVRTDLESALHREITAVRADLSKTEKALSQEIASVKTELTQKIDIVSDDLSDFKKEFVEYKQDTGERFNGVMTALDGLAGLILNGQIERSSVNHALNRHEGTLNDHETRIVTLERKGV